MPNRSPNSLIGVKPRAQGSSSHRLPVRCSNWQALWRCPDRKQASSVRHGHGDKIAERQCGAERNAGPRVVPLHDGGGVVAHCEKRRNGFATSREHPPDFVDRETRSRPEITRTQFDGIVRGNCNLGDARVWLMSSIPEVALVRIATTVEFKVFASPGRFVEALDSIGEVFRGRRRSFPASSPMLSSRSR